MNKMASSASDAIKPLCWLIGKWTSTCAKGKLPENKSFDYNEDLEFTFYGQPMLAYSSKTYMGPERKPMHFESGFLRIKPGTNNVSLLIAHNFGVTSVEEGEISNDSMQLKSINIGRMSFGAEPAVCELVRNYKACGDKMELLVCMATSKTPLTEHLRVSYKKADSC